MDLQAIVANENLFKLQCLIKTTEIQHSVQCKLEGTLFLALATTNAEIILYFKRASSCLPVVKKIPWFQGPHKQIAAFCFDSSGIWLLCVTLDGSLYIVPALTLVDETCIVDKRWKTDDATYIPFVTSQLSHFRPRAVTWWKDMKMSMDIGIVGTECGATIFINLLNGQQLGITYITESISGLHICRNEYNEIASLLITSNVQQQWRLPLEHASFNLLPTFENKEPTTNQLNSNGTRHVHATNAGESVPTKSKLQELKQLSVEKLARLKQKIRDTKNQPLGESLQCHDAASIGESGTGCPVNLEIAESNVGFISPEPISRDTFLSLQYDREDRQLYTCYHPVTTYITIHGPDLTVVPLSRHKIFECETVLLAHRLFFITDVNQRAIYIISDQLSETRINRDYQFNPESVIGTFSFKNSKEVIRAVYKVTKFDNIVPRKVSEEIESKCTLPKNVRDIKSEPLSLDTCIIVTTRCVYQVVLRKSLLSVFMDVVLKKNELQKAGKLAMVFGLTGQHLLEYVGDIFLSNKDVSRAVASYKISKCKLLKSVLKFASIGHTSELLSCLTHCLLTPVITEMPRATRIHLSNLCVLSFIEMTLRVWSEQSKAIYKEFLYFLSTNTFYDELLAINIAGQTYLWEVVHHLATQRSLYNQMLDILVKAIQIFGTNDIYPKSYGLLICLSESDLMQSMLLNYDLARAHVSFVRSNLRDSQIFVLQRLVTLYDPTNPVLRPKLVQCKARHKVVACTQRSTQCHSIDSMDNMDQPDTLVEEIIETFILVLLTLIHKKRLLNPNGKYAFLYDVHVPKVSNKDYSGVTPHVDFKRRSLSTGFSHVALVRNGNIYTWGSSVQGCLGTGSSVLRYGTPHAICFFKSMKIEVFSVACGHCHTLAVTNNGIYAWGASQFGQLGLGKVLQCSSPELITSLAQEIIIDAVAGQYHSVALTADGRIFTWGWGVHGQLGLGNTDEKATPSMVKTLLGVVVCYISAGYAHTLALAVDGVVYAFGCNVLGQLGTGDTAKSSIPTKVALPDGITLISTGYFHNLAVTNANNVYIWGASPQVLRLQAQAQKKTRILEQRDATEKKSKALEEPEKRTNLNEEIKEDVLVDGVQTESAQTKARTSDIETQKRPETENAALKGLNFGLTEESQAHLKPCVVDTSLVKGQINQISAGCHHNALITKDGSLYTWGRNLDGQIGNGTRREVSRPTPLYYTSACVFAQIPPRHNDFKRMQNQWDLDTGAKSIDSLVNNGNASENNGNISDSSVRTGNAGLTKERINPIINAVGIACGYDYTVAIQPGGTVLAWGNNSRAQLGRIPAKEAHDADDKLVLLKSSKRIVRLPTALHIALDVPSQVPGISTPVISYRSNDAFSLAGSVRPLSVIERSPGDVTLHYILEHFYGLYTSANIIEKCIELENYQACSKIAALENNVPAAFTYQLKMLHNVSLQSSRNSQRSEREVSHERINSTLETSSPNVDMTRDSMLSRDIKRNTELFNRQAEKNLIDALENSVARSWTKISTSRSLNTLQTLAQDVYSFDCQGGLEELCGTRKDDDGLSLNVNTDHSDTERNANNEDEQRQGWIEDLIFNDVTLRNSAQTSSRSVCTKANLSRVNDDRCDVNEEKTVFLDKVSSRSQRTQDAIGRYLKNVSKMYDEEGKAWCANSLFSIKFCLRVLSMLMQRIDEDDIMPEYVEIFSSLMADTYGAPLNGYPGTSRNNTPGQMMEGIVSTVFSEMEDSRLFTHIKDSDAINHLLTTEEDNMIFTCGHHFPISLYEADVVPTMETELLTSPSLTLPCTSQYLGDMLPHTSKPEILCPLCIRGALRVTTVKD
ncbi:RCC1 and BTB domain containing protein claret isoform X3 [Temnothorax americanus]|uniref:RCC1 and BTB domain containing protein claret isoform X3 n=1 Tax=Temnothorax americanus TaxID=1964332 RepID=UPI0040687447